MTKKIIFVIGLIIVIILVAYLLTDEFGLFKVELKQEWKSCNNDQECSLVSTPGCCSCSDEDAINSKFINEYNKYRRSNTGICWRVVCSICPQRFRVARCVDNKCIATDWQTFRNEKYGFEVKYPPTLKIWENQHLGTTVIYDVSFENPLSDSKLVGRKIVFHISIYSNVTQLQDVFSVNSDPYRTRIDQGEATIGGYQAQKFLFEPKNPNEIEATVYLVDDKNTAIIVFGTDLHKISEADINRILSTFKFTR